MDYPTEVAGLAKLKNYIEIDFHQILVDFKVDHLIGTVKPSKALQEYIAFYRNHCDYASYYELNMIQVPCSYVSSPAYHLLLKSWVKTNRNHRAGPS